MQPRSSAASPRLASWTRIVVIRSPSSSASQAASASRSATSSKLSPVSSRQLPSPLERGSPTPSSRVAGRAVDHLAVEHRPAVVGEVVADEVAVVVVAGHRPPAVVVRSVVERRVQRVERERLPGAAGRGVVAGVEDGLGAGRVGDRPGDRVHADVVVPVGDQQRPRSRPPPAHAGRGRRPPRRRRGRRSCPRRRCRPRSRSAAGSGWW